MEQSQANWLCQPGAPPDKFESVRGPSTLASNSDGITVVWWRWLLTTLAFAYAACVIEVIVSFAAQGSPKAALGMGSDSGKAEGSPILDSFEKMLPALALASEAAPRL